MRLVSISSPDPTCEREWGLGTRLACDMRAYAHACVARRLVLQMAWKTIICISLALFAWGSAVKAYVPVSNNMRSFSSAIKGGSIKANEEKVLYEHSTGQSGVITEQWFTGVCMCIYAPMKL